MLVVESQNGSRFNEFASADPSPHRLHQLHPSDLTRDYPARRSTSSPVVLPPGSMRLVIQPPQRTRPRMVSTGPRLERLAVTRCTVDALEQAFSYVGLRREVVPETTLIPTWNLTP